MARSNLTVNTVVQSGINLPSGTAGTSDGHMFANDGSVFIHAKNGNAGARTVVFVTTNTEAGLAYSDLTVSVQGSGTASGEKYLGPFPVGVFNQVTGADTGKVYINFTSTGNEADVTIRAFHLG